MQSGYRRTAIAVLTLVLLRAQPGHGHALDLPAPTVAEQAQVEPPLAGALTFANELLARADGWRTVAQADAFTRLEAHLAAMARTSTGPTAAPAVAAFHRWQAERALLEIVAASPNLLTLSTVEPESGAPPKIDLAPTGNQILLRVASGPGPIRFDLQTVDLISVHEPGGYVVRAAPAGTTYILLAVQNVPAGQTTTALDLRTPDATTPGARRAITVTSAPWGQLAVDVRDETGAPTPVMLRLTAVAGHRLWEPAGAVDLRPMMNDIMGLPTMVGPGRGYSVYVPPPFGGTYWIVPGPFDMALPAGEWEIHVLHGPEYVPVHETVTVTAGQWTRHRIALARWTDMRRRGWYSGDDHIHARVMHSEDASKLLAYLRATDVAVGNTLEMGDSTRTYYTQRGFGPTFRVADGDHWIVPGQEDPRSAIGHVIGLNLQARVRDPAHYLEYDAVAAAIHRQGGLYGHAHASDGACDAPREMALFTPMGFVDFTVVMQNRLGTELLYDFLNLGFRMTISAGTDSPQQTVGRVRLYAFAGDATPFSPDAWFAAVQHGHTFVTNGPMIELWVDDAMPGDEIPVDADRPLHVRARAWGLRGASAPVKLEVVQLGTAVASATPAQVDDDALAIDTTLPAGFGGWIAAHTVGRDGTEAHTTPVYVVRKGYRPWNADRADAIIAKELTVLDGVERAVGEAEARVRLREGAVDEATTTLAEQGASLRQRIATSRETYQQLRLVLTNEQPRRKEPPAVVSPGSP